jgi:hypothetical protein
MNKVIKFKCPHGNHSAYFHSVDNVFCLTHGRLLYTDIPAELQKKKKYKSDFLKKTLDKNEKKLKRLSIKIGKAIVEAMQ